MAKVDMKDRMAKMRAAKAAKAKPSSAPASKKTPKKQQGAIADTAPPPGKEFLTSAPVNPQPKKAPAQEQQKSWKLKSMADFSKLPREQVSYVMFYMKTEILRAIVHGKTIEHFVWTEGQRLETKYVGEDKAENAFE